MSIALKGAPVSYRSIVMNQFYNRSFINCSVPGALTAYDLPDLMASLAPRRILIQDPKDHMNNVLGRELIEKINAAGTLAQNIDDPVVNDFKFPFSFYHLRGADKNIAVNGYDDIVKTAGWCFGH
jgi:hypothetical protein